MSALLAIRARAFAIVALAWSLVFGHFHPHNAGPLFGSRRGNRLVDVALGGFCVLVAGLAHGSNMLRYPYYENDEGTYVSQAWAVMSGNGLASYTYWYDHPPLGWILVAGWSQAFRWLEQYGATPIDIGRTFMLTVQVVSAGLVWVLARRITGRASVATFATLIFALSPLATLYHRRVLLDNILTMLVLGAMALLLLRKTQSLTPVALSGAIFGAALLSKHSVGFVFIPAMIVALLLTLDRRHLFLGLTVWVLSCGTVFSSWIVYALLRNELFPTGFFPWDTEPHTSLIGALQYHLARGGNEAGMFSLNNDFWIRMRTLWLPNDPYLMLFGFASIVACALGAIRKPILAVPALAALFMGLFLARGMLVIEYYFLPIVPWFAIGIAASLAGIAGVAKSLMQRVLPSFARPLAYAAPSAALSTVLGLWTMSYVSSPYVYNLHFEDQVTAQVEAIVWAQEHIPKDATIITDQYALLDLWRVGLLNAHYYWKSDFDPLISEGVFASEWRNVDYLLVTPQVHVDMAREGMDLTSGAYRRSSPTQFNTRLRSLWEIELRRVDLVEVGAVRITEEVEPATGRRLAVATATLAGTKRPIENVNVLLEIRDAGGTVLAKGTALLPSLARGAPAPLRIVMPWPEGADKNTVLVLGAFDSAWSDTLMWQTHRELFAPPAPPAAPGLGDSG